MPTTADNHESDAIESIPATQTPSRTVPYSEMGFDSLCGPPESLTRETASVDVASSLIRQIDSLIESLTNLPPEVVAMDDSFKEAASKAESLKTVVTDAKHAAGRCNFSQDSVEGVLYAARRTVDLAHETLTTDLEDPADTIKAKAEYAVILAVSTLRPVLAHARGFRRERE